MRKSNGCDHGNSFQELKRKLEEECCYDESEIRNKLTLIVLEGFVNRVVKESTDNLMHKTCHNGKKKEMMKKEKKEMMKKEKKQSHMMKKEKKQSHTLKQGKPETRPNLTGMGFERPPPSMPKELKICIQNMGTKRCRESGTLSCVIEEEKEDYVIPKEKKQRTCDNGKKKQKTNRPKNDQKDPNVAKFIEMGLEPPPDMPQEFKDCIQNLGGTDIKLVIQKFIQVTDLSSSHNRFSMSFRQVKNNEFLNEEEKRKLNDKSNKNPMEVVLVQPCGEVSTLNLNKWDIGASPSYVLNGAGYKNVVNNNQNSLKPKAVVQIWSFRVGQDLKLGFAMIKVTDGEEHV